MRAVRRFKAPLALGAVFVALAIWWPDVGERSASVTLDYLAEMALILPAVFVLMGLLQVWVPSEKITQWIGAGSGLKGVAVSFLLGTMPTGPLYVAFPMAATLLRKGARMSNVVTFLGAWAAVKIPQLVVEAEFLGYGFMALRLVLTLASLVLIGQLMERVARPDDLPEPEPT